MDALSLERIFGNQVEAWKSQLRAACQLGQMSEGGSDAYGRKTRSFDEFVAVIDAISEAKLEEFYAYLSGRLTEGAYSPTTSIEILMSAKQFIFWLVERKLIALPGNIDSRRSRFNHSVATTSETFSLEKIRRFRAA